MSMLKSSMKLGCRTISVLQYRVKTYHSRDQIGMILKTRGLRSVFSDAEMPANKPIRILKFNIIGDQMIKMQAVIC